MQAGRTVCHFVSRLSHSETADDAPFTAFQTGDPEFVNDMYEAIKDALDANPLNVIDPVDVRKQLEREFEITMSSVEDV